MSLYLPPELRWLGWIAGGTWPEGDEDKIWAISNAYKDTAAALRKVIPDIEDAKRVAVSAYSEGSGGDKIGDLFGQMLRGDQSVESLAHFMDQISDATNDFGTSIQGAKLMTIVSLVALAIEIAWAWAFPPTAPAEQAAAEAATQIALRRLELQIQEKIVAKVLSVFGEKFANLSKGWVMKILEGALISGGLDAAVQVGQIGSGHKKHFDWKEFGAALGAGGVGTPFGVAGANWINKYTTKFFGDKLANPWVRTLNGAIVGIGSAPVFVGFGNIGAAAVTGDWEGTFTHPAGWVGGAAHGGISGGFKGHISGGGSNNKSFEVNWKMPGDGSVNIPIRGGFSDDPGGLGPHGSRNVFDGGHGTTQNPPVGSNGSRGSNQHLVDNSYLPGHGPGSYGAAENSPPPTHPASFTGSGHSEGPPAPPPGRSSQHEPGSDGGSNSYNHNGSQSGGSSNSGQHETLASNQATFGGSSSSSNGGSGGSNGGSRSSNGGSGSSSGPSIADRSQSPASSNHSGSSGSSSDSGGAPPPRTSSNPSGDGRNSSAVSGPSDRPAGGPPATRPSPGSDGSVPVDRPPMSQTPKGGISTTPSRSTTPEVNITAGQSQRGPASVSDVSSVGSGQSPRSSAVSEASSTGPGQPPRRPFDAGPEGTPPPRSPGTDMGADSPKPPRSSGSGSGDQLPPSRRPPGSESDSGGVQPPRQRPPESDSNSSQRRQPPEGDRPPRGSVAPDRHSGPGGQRGHDDAEPGSRTFEGDQEHPNWARSESGEVVVTSPDGTEHWVDKQQNIFVGRPEDPAWVKVGPDGSVEFVPKNGNDPVAEHGPRAGEPVGSGRGEDFVFDRGDGTQHTVLDEGSVQTKSPDGSTTIVKRDGGAELHSPWGDRTYFDPEGTATHTRPDDPTIVTTHDNTVHIRTPGRERDEDGNLVVTSPDGTRHVVGDDGTILVGRTGDPQWLKIDADHSIVFVGPDGTVPPARPGAVTGKGTDGQSQTFGRPNGVSHTVLGDGSVQTKSPGDWTTTVRTSGATEFTSPTGDKMVFKADDTAVVSGPGKPTEITGPDQTKQITEHDGMVTVEHPDSTKHVVFDSGDPQGGGRTLHPDQTVIHHDLNDTLKIGAGDRVDGVDADGPRKPGVVQMSRPDGIGFESSPKGIKVFDENSTTYERGSGGSVRITEANGHTETQPMKEPIELSNGARLEKTPEGFRVTHEDNSVSEIGLRGASFTDGDGVVRGTRTDGTAFVKHGDDGPLREVRGDGAVRITEPDRTSWGSRGDGTTWHVDDNNKVHVSPPDGTVAPPVDPKSAYVAGGHLTSKVKPHPLHDNDELPGGYQAPIAPDAEDWIPPGYEKDDGPPDPGPPNRDPDHWGPPKPFLWGPPDPDYWGPPDPNYSGPPDSDHWGPPDPGPGDGNSSNSDPYNHDRNSPGPGGDNYRHGTGSSDNSGNSGGSGGGGDNSGGSRSGGGNSGDSGDRDGSGGGHDTSGNDRQPPPERRQPPPPPRLDPETLSRMLQNLHGADEMVPPPGQGDSGQGLDGPGEQSPDFSHLSGLGNDPLSPKTTPGGESGPTPPDLSALRGALDQLRGQGPGGPAQQGGSDRSDSSESPGAGNRPGSPNGPASQDTSGGSGHRGTAGSGGESDGSGSPGNSHGQQTPGSKLPGGEDHPGGSGPGDQAGAGGPQGSGDRSGAPNSADPSGAHTSDDRSDAPRSEGDPGARDSGDPSGAPGAGDHQGAPGSGSHAGAPGSPDHSSEPGHSRDLGQQGNSSQPGGGSGSQHPATPGRPPASPMQDGHSQAGSSAPGGAPPPGASPAGVPPGGAAGSQKKKERRQRKKDDKPRKTPKSILMPSPFEEPEQFEAPEQRAGLDNAVDVPFDLGGTSPGTEPVVDKRPTTKTTRSTSDG